MQALLDENLEIRRVFWWLTFVENAISNEWAVCLGRRSAQERMAHLICELAARLSAIGDVRDDSFVLPLTQEELANALGLSVVHVNRILQGLRHDGLVAQRGGRLKILERNALARLCDFRPSYLHLNGLHRRCLEASAA